MTTRALQRADIAGSVPTASPSPAPSAELMDLATDLIGQHAEGLSEKDRRALVTGTARLLDELQRAEREIERLRAASVAGQPETASTGAAEGVAAGDRGGRRAEIAAPAAAPGRDAPPRRAADVIRPDAEIVFLDKAANPHRLEDLPPDVRREVDEAVRRSKDPEVLATNDSLREVSVSLHAHVRDVPSARQFAIVVAAAHVLDDAGRRLRWAEWAAERRAREVERLMHANGDLRAWNAKLTECLKGWHDRARSA